MGPDLKNKNSKFFTRCTLLSTRNTGYIQRHKEAERERMGEHNMPTADRKAGMVVLLPDKVDGKT